MLTKSNGTIIERYSGQKAFSTLNYRHHQSVSETNEITTAAKCH